MKYYNILYYSLLISVFFICCKTDKITEYKTIDESSPPTIEELGNKFYKYKRDESIYNFRLQKKISLQFDVYTNVEPYPNNLKIPRQVTNYPFTSNDFKDVDYFEKKLNKKYVLYMKKDNHISMREYGEFFTYQNKIKDSLRWTNLEKEIFDSLNKNQIKYKIDYRFSKDDYTWIKLTLLDKNYYSYITISPRSVITNTYYQPKDTLFLINEYGKSLF